MSFRASDRDITLGRPARDGLPARRSAWREGGSRLPRSCVMTGMDPPSPEASARQARETELALVGRLRDGDPDAFDAVHDAFNTQPADEGQLGFAVHTSHNARARQS